MERWLQVLDTYKFDIENRARKKHGDADAMSRGPCKQCGDVRVVTRAQKKRNNKEEQEV